MSLKNLILAALSEYQGRPVLGPVIVNMVVKCPGIVEKIKKEQQEWDLLVAQHNGKEVHYKWLNSQQVKDKLAWKVRMTLTKLDKSGLIRKIDLLELRGGKITNHVWVGHTYQPKRKGQKPSKFWKLVKKMKLVFSDFDQLKHSQGAYQITDKGLAEINNQQVQKFRPTANMFSTEEEIIKFLSWK